MEMENHENRILEYYSTCVLVCDGLASSIKILVNLVVTCQACALSRDIALLEQIFFFTLPCTLPTVHKH